MASGTAVLTPGTIVRVNDNYPDEWVRGLTGEVIDYNDQFVRVTITNPPESYMVHMNPWLFYERELTAVNGDSANPQTVLR